MCKRLGHKDLGKIYALAVADLPKSPVFSKIVSENLIIAKARYIVYGSRLKNFLDFVVDRPPKLKPDFGYYQMLRIGGDGGQYHLGL